MQRSPFDVTRLQRAGLACAVTSLCVLLSACGGASGFFASNSTNAPSGSILSTTSSTTPGSDGTGTSGSSATSTIAIARSVPSSFKLVSWAAVAYPDQAQCALPGSSLAGPLAVDTTISGAPYYFHGNGGKDFAVVPLRCVETNSLTDMVLLYAGTGTPKPQLVEVLVAGASPASDFGVPVETVAASFTAVLAPKDSFALFHGGSLALCGGMYGSTSGAGGPYYLNSFFFLENGASFNLVGHQSSSRPSSSGGPCPPA